MGDLVSSPAAFADLLALDPVGVDGFLGIAPGRGHADEDRLFGGQVVAQALWAARATIDQPWPCHSLHAYFLRAGALDESVLFSVQRARDGRSFISRRVNASQRAGVILTLDASFHRPESDAPSWDPTPAVSIPEPDTLPMDDWDTTLSDRRAAAAGSQERGRFSAWLRMNGTLGEDPFVHEAAIAYMSDRVPMNGVRLAFDPPAEWDRLIGASLDHAIWFHRSARADQWLLMDVTTNALGDSRGLAFGSVRTHDGQLVASIAQECLARQITR
jgi:acyl-CoA thioesterase II